MINATEKEAYILDLCTKNKAVAHSETHRHFVSLEDEEALAAAITTGLEFPCVVMLDVSGRIINKRESYRKLWDNSLWFIHRVKMNANEQANKKEAYQISETIMNQFISRMLDDFEENEGCGAFMELNAETFRFKKTGKVIDNAYGWRLDFNDEEKATDLLNYDASKWND